MKNLERSLIIGIGIFLPLLIGCTEKQPPKNASVYEKVLYENTRPTDDRKTDYFRKPDKILAFAKLKAGMKIIDMDAGSGYYSEIASHLVGPTGTIYLQNSLRFVTKYPDKIVKRLENNRLTNVQRIDSSYAALELPENVDLIMIVKAFHDLFVHRSNPLWNADIDSYIEQVKSSLRSGGRVLLIDHSAVLGSETRFSKTLHRIDENYVSDLFLSRGFKLIALSDLLRNHGDNRTLKIWNESVRNNTDRFVFLFEKEN